MRILLLSLSDILKFWIGASHSRSGSPKFITKTSNKRRGRKKLDVRRYQDTDIGNHIPYYHLTSRFFFLSQLRFFELNLVCEIVAENYCW
jgi:hypothetical protein